MSPTTPGLSLSPVAAQLVKRKKKRVAMGDFDTTSQAYMKKACAEYLVGLVTIDPFDRDNRCAVQAWDAVISRRSSDEPNIAIDMNIFRVVRRF
jgi:hypothetical protein